MVKLTVKEKFQQLAPYFLGFAVIVAFCMWRESGKELSNEEIEYKKKMMQKAAREYID